MSHIARRLAMSACLALSGNSVLAAEGQIGPVFIKSVGDIAQNDIGHRAGNFEIQLAAPFVLPAGVNCDTSYITTLAVNDPDKKLFALAVTAQATRSPVQIYISDAASLTAFGGRCSIIALTMTQ